MDFNINIDKVLEVADNSSATSKPINGIDVSDKNITATSNPIVEATFRGIGNVYSENKEDYIKEIERNNVIRNRYTTEEELNLLRAKNQSWLEQTGRSLAQIVGNEVVLGSLLGFTNIYDVAATAVKELAADARGEENINDFTSAASLALEQAQDKMKERLAIYRENPNQSFDIGDFAWWADNFVTVGSTLSLLIPTMATTKGISTLGKLAKHNKLVKAGKSATAISRDMDKASKLSRSLAMGARDLGWNKYPASLAKTLDAAASIGANAVLQRTLESWQESREVYKATYDDALNKLNQMNSEEMDSFLTRNKEVFYNEDGTAKFKNNEELAGLIAEKSGYKTFATDYVMLLMDIPQFAGINSLWRGLATKKATNALRIANKNAIKGISTDLSSGVQKGVVTEAGKRIIDGVDDKLIKNNFFNRIKEGLKHPGSIFTNLELTEGIEEGYQGIMSEKGKEVADFIFDPNTDKRSLESYLSDPTIWEQAFWGIMGGIAFKAGGTALGNLERKITGSINKKNMSEEDFAKTQITEEKLRELEIVGRYDTMMDLKSKLDLINEGKNPFKMAEDGKDYAAIEEGQQDAVRAAVVNNFLTKLTLDATDNGNFDLLVDFVSSQEFTKYLKDIGIYDEVSTKFNNTLIENMKSIRETYQQELHKGLEYDDIDNPYLINMLARLNTRKKLTVQDLNSELNAIAKELNVDLNYENEAQRQYHLKVLEQIEKRLNAIIKGFNDNHISREGYEQYIKDFREELNILYSEIGVYQTEEYRNESDPLKSIKDIKEILTKRKEENPDSYKQDETNKPTAEQLILLQKKLNTQWQRAKEDGSIAKLDAQWRRDYERLERSVVEEVKKRYDNAKEKLSNFIKESEDVDKAVEDLMTGNFDNKEIQEALDLIKIGYHGTANYWSEILDDAQAEAIIRAQRVVADATNVVDGRLVKDTSDDSGLEDEIEGLTNPPSTGEITPTTPAEPEVKPTVPPELESGLTPTPPPVEREMPELSDPTPPKVDTTIPNVNVNLINELQYKVNRYILDNLKTDVGIYINDLLEHGELDRESYNNLYQLIKENVLAGETTYSEEDIAKIIKGGIRAFISTKKGIKEIKGLDSTQEIKLIKALGENTDLASEFDTINILPIEERPNAVFDAIKYYLINSGIDIENSLNNIGEIDIVDLFKDIIKSRPNISYIELLNIYRMLSPYISNGIKGEINGTKVHFKFNNQSKAIYKGNFDTFLFNKISNFGLTKQKVLNTLSMETPRYRRGWGGQEILEKIKNGEIQNPKLSIQEDPRYTNTLSIRFYDEKENEWVEIGRISRVKKIVNEDGSTIIKNIHSTGLQITFTEDGQDIDTNFDELFTQLHLAQIGENNGYDTILRLIDKYDNGVQFTEQDFNDLMSLSEIKRLYDEGHEEQRLNVNSFERTKGGFVLDFFKFDLNGRPDEGSKSYQAEKIISYIAQVLVDPDGNRNFEDIYGHWKAYSSYVKSANEQVYETQERLAKGENVEVEIVIDTISAPNMLEESVGVSETFKADEHAKYPIFVVQDGIGTTENGMIVNSSHKFNGMIGIKLHPTEDITTYLETTRVKDSNSGIIEDLRTEIKSIIKGYLENEQGYSFDEVAAKLTRLLSGDVKNKLFSNIKVHVSNGFIKISRYVNLSEESAESADVIIAFDKYSSKSRREKAKDPNAKVLENHGVLNRKAGDKKGSFFQTYDEGFADSVVNEILEHIKFNFSKMAFGNDEVTKEKSPYFYKENGKIVVEIGGNKRVYDSYAQFLYSENAAKTYIARDENGNILTGQTITSSKGTPIIIKEGPKATPKTTNKVNTLDGLFNKAKNRKNKNIKTRELLEAAGLNSSIIDIILNEIDGIGMVDGEIYLMSKEQKKNHPNAYFIYNKDTKLIYINPDKFKFTDVNKDIRVELIRSLIHEKFHKTLNLAEEANPIKKKEIVNELLNTYIKFVESLNEQKDTNPLAAAISSQFSAFINKYKVKDGELYINDKKANKEVLDDFVEEWLIESLTQPAILQYNNQVEYGDADISKIDGKSKSIFQKIIDAIINLYTLIAKSFGKQTFKIKNNTILAKQYVLLSNELGNTIKKETVKEVEQKPVIKNTEKTGEEAKPIIPEAPNGSPVEGNASAEITQETKERIAKARNRREIKRIKLSEELESVYGFIDYGTETIEESKLQESVINDNVNTSGAVTMNNVSEFMDLFSEDEKLKLANLKANNGLNYVCQ